jgi:Tol biopolymer transport system component
MPLGEVGSYLEQIADAIDDAHTQGLIHRDIKPQNILLDQRGRPLVADFGLATAISSTSSSVLMETATSGTPLYMAPEQWQGRAGKASDIYALGVMLYQMITGVPPFLGNQYELMGQHLNEPPPPLSARAPDLHYPPALDEVLAVAMAKDPAARPRPAKELSRRFRAAIESRPVTLSPSSSTQETVAAVAPVAEKAEATLPLTHKSGPVTTEKAAPGKRLSAEINLGGTPVAGSSAKKGGLSCRVVAEIGAAVMTVMVIGAVVLTVFMSGNSKGNTSGLPGQVVGGALPPTATVAAQATPAANAAPTFAVVAISTVTPAPIATTDPLSIPSGGGGGKVTTAAATTVAASVVTTAAATTAAAPASTPGPTALATRPNPTTPPGTQPPVTGIQFGQQIGNLTGHTAGVWLIAFSPDSKLLASAGIDGTVRLWDIASRKQLNVLKGHTDDWVRAVAFSPNGKILASASRDKTIKLWEIPGGKELKTLTSHTDFVETVAFSPDGKLLASGSDDGTIRLWNAGNASFSEIKVINVPSGVNSVAFSSDSKLLVSGGNDGVVRLWDLTSYKEVTALKGHTKDVLAVAFSRDGKTIASGSADGTARLWDTSGNPLFVFKLGNEVKDVAISPDGTMLAIACADSTARLWDTATGKELITLTGHTSAVYSVAFSPDGRMLATGSNDQAIKLWEVRR